MQTAIVAENVEAGDVLCSAKDPAKLTKATPAALAAGTMPKGVAAEAAEAGTRVSYYVVAEQVPPAISGLGFGLPTAVVVNDSGRVARERPLEDNAFIVGQCDAAGVVTVRPEHGFASVMDFGAKGDGLADDWAAITAAMNSLTPGTGRGTVYFPAGYYLISRPLVIGGDPGVEFRGESEHTSVIRFFTGGHGPALCVSPDNVGHLPTTDALLAGAGKAGVLNNSSLNTVNLRDSPALDMDGCSAFSIECTVHPDALPNSYGHAVITSSGRRMSSDPPNNAFGVYLYESDGTILVSATAHIGSQNVELNQLGPIPLGQTTHIALIYDGATLRLFAGAPGSLTRSVSKPAAGKLRQAIEEGVYLGILSNYNWPEYLPKTRSFTGKIDSIRVSNYATRKATPDESTSDVEFIAPTAKFPSDDGSNSKPDPADPNKRHETRLLINFDQDVDVFTVGHSWYGLSSAVPVYLMHNWQDGQPSHSRPAIQRLGFQSPWGAGIQGQLALSCVIDRVKVSSARDGIRLRNNSYLAELEHISIQAARIGLALGGATSLVNVKRLQTEGTQYDFVATDVVGVFARDWYIGGSSSIAPVLLTASGYYGFFHGVGISISSENVQFAPGQQQTWQAAVMTSNVPSVVFESTTFETVLVNKKPIPSVIIDYSRTTVNDRQFDGVSTFINCDFVPSPLAPSILAFSGDLALSPVRIIGSRSSNQQIPWTRPQHAHLVSFIGGCVSTTDAGLIQWMGTRDWVFAFDSATGHLQARERETQATGTVAAGSIDLATVAIVDGATSYQAEVVATDPDGRAARWTLEHGFTKTTAGISPWSATTRIVNSFGSDNGAVPPGWPAPSLALSNGNVVVRCAEQAGVTLAFTVKLRALEALLATS